MTEYSVTYERHLQCAEQVKSPSNFTNYAACHEIKSSRFLRKILELPPPIIYKRFDDNPRIIRGWNRHLAPAAWETLLPPSWRRTLYWNLHHLALRLSSKIARKCCACHEKCHSNFTILHLPRKVSEAHDWVASHMNVIYNEQSK